MRVVEKGKKSRNMTLEAAVIVELLKVQWSTYKTTEVLKRF